MDSPKPSDAPKANCGTCVHDRQPGNTCERPYTDLDTERAIVGWQVDNCDLNGNPLPSADHCPGYAPAGAPNV